MSHPNLHAFAFAQSQVQAAREQEQRWRAEAEAREGSAAQSQALQEALARWVTGYWSRMQSCDGGDGADAALACAVAEELPAVLDVDQARLFVVGDGGSGRWTPP